MMFGNLSRFFSFSRDVSNELNRKLINRNLFERSRQSSGMIEYKIWSDLIDGVIGVSLRIPITIRMESENQNRKYIEKTLLEQIELDSLN